MSIVNPAVHRARVRDDEMTTKPTAITRYWLAHYLDPATQLCTLCGNTGRIDTRETAISSAGVNAGSVSFCICPNGQAKRSAASLAPAHRARITR